MTTGNHLLDSQCKIEDINAVLLDEFSRAVGGSVNQFGHPLRHAELVAASIFPSQASACVATWTLKQVQGDDCFEGVG